MIDSADGVNRLFQGLRPRSKHSMKTAIEAVMNDGLTGTLIIQIAAGVDKPTEVFFMNAELRLVPGVGLLQ